LTLKSNTSSFSVQIALYSFTPCFGGTVARIYVLLVFLLAPRLASPFITAEQSSLPVVAANDNRTPAGDLQNGILRLSLELRQARWYAEANDGIGKDVYAFAEPGHSPQSSGPLLRVRQGTHIRVTLHNLLPAAAKVYGLHGHPGDANHSVELKAGETREVEFDAGAPGTYSYWATTSNARFDHVEERQGDESLLTGAFVVDPPHGNQDDRIFVLVEWSKNEGPDSGVILAMNGKSWPETEHLTYKAGETVHWRIINATPMPHAMHLHGFFFTVDGVGDPTHWSEFSPSQRRHVVTEPIEPGHSFSMSWTPDREGNWLFHCHMALHMAPLLALHPPQAKPAAYSADHDHSAGMGGLVMGVTVIAGTTRQVLPTETRKARQLQLAISDNPDKVPLYKLDLIDPAVRPRAAEKKVPSLLGPPIVLSRGEPVEIEVQNHSSSPTAIHWHGIELENYYDGVPGWSRSDKEITSAIAPGTSFVARFTPPRAGTFIYHSHWHDPKQIQNGLYGPLIVLPPGESLNAEQDHSFVFSVGIYPPLGFMLLINGQPAPDPRPLKVGMRYRFRLINITDEGADLRVRLTSQQKPVTWKVTARDGADLPADQITDSAADMILTVGATCDVELTPSDSGPLDLEISSEGLGASATFPFLASK
jgi:FtsP/CotA-like multicopper oxidase with cupredoxin domain